MAWNEGRWRSDRERWRSSEEEHGRGGYGQETYGREEGGAPEPEGSGGRVYGREGYRERTGSYGGESYGRRSYGGYEGSFGGYGREGYGGREGRGLSERASGEAASWFGDRDAAPRREQDYRGRGPKGYRRSDDRIREDVNDRLTDDPYLDASDIDVSISHSEVTLNGTVDSRYARRRAEDLAENISGVIHVQNNLRVRQAQGGSDEIARGMSASGSGAAPGTEESSGRAGDSSR